MSNQTEEDNGLQFDEEDQHVEEIEMEPEVRQEQNHVSDDIAGKLENVLDETDNTRQADIEKVMEIVTSSSSKPKRKKGEKKLSKLEEESAYSKFQRHQQVNIKIAPPQLKSGLVTMNKFRQKTPALVKQSTRPKISADIVLRKREQLDNSRVNWDDDDVELEVVDFLEQPTRPAQDDNILTVNLLQPSIEPPHIDTQLSIPDRLESDEPKSDHHVVPEPPAAVEEQEQAVEPNMVPKVTEAVPITTPTPPQEEEEEEMEQEEEDDGPEPDDNDVDHPDYVNIEERPESIFAERQQQPIATTVEPKRFVAPHSKGARLFKLALSQTMHEDVTSSQTHDIDDEDVEELPELHTPTPRSRPNTANLVVPSLSLSIQVPTLTMPSLDPSSATPLGKKRPRSFLENGGAQKVAKFAKAFNEQKRKENILPNLKKTGTNLQPPKKKRRVK